jgi:hypothetical protein
MGEQAISMAMCFIPDVFTVVLKWKEYRSVDYITVESHESGCFIDDLPLKRGIKPQRNELLRIR